MEAGFSQIQSHIMVRMQFTQECVYKYNTAQYSFGEEEREKLFFLQMFIGTVKAVSSYAAVLQLVIK